MDLLARLEDTDFSLWLRESDWGQPILLCFHAVGMALVVGLSLMFSARVLGYARGFPLSAFDRLFGIAWFGFAVNAASGTLLFVSEPRRLLQTPAFLIKMVLIVGAGLSLWVLTSNLAARGRTRRRRGVAGQGGGDAECEARRVLSDRAVARRHPCRPPHWIHDWTAPAVTAAERATTR